MKHHAFFFLVAGRSTAIPHRQVLQLTLTALITNGTIERVIDEQELHHRFLRLESFFTLRPDNHALRHRGGTSWKWFGGLVHIDQAHATVRGDAEFFVITKMRNVGARGLGGMHDHAAFTHFDGFVINLYFNHDHSPCSTLTPSKQRLCTMWCSNSGRKCLSMPCTGMAAASPKAQMVRPEMFAVKESKSAKSPSWP